MTIGEKIRQARKHCRLSQEQLAELMCISRSAIAKWETDKGLPDIENIRILSNILHISTDWLLNPQQDGGHLIYRYSVDLSRYGKGCSRLRKDRCVREKFQNAQITALISRKDVIPGDAVTKEDALVRRNVHNCFLSNGSMDSSASYYLVTEVDRQFLVAIAESYIEYRILQSQINDGEFILDGMRFVRFSEIE